MHKQIIRRYLILSTFSRFGISFILGTYVLFLRSKGLDQFQVQMVNLAFVAGMLVFEIPTGAIADLFGRRLSLITSCLLRAVSMYLYATSHSMSGFVFAEIVDALGCTFAHGAFQSWVMDGLKGIGCQDRFRGVLIRENQIGYLISIPSAIIGCHLAKLNPSLPWYAAAVSMLISAFLMYRFMHEKARPVCHCSILNSWHDLQLTITNSVRYARENKTIRFIFALGLLQYFTTTAPNMQWQPYFQKSLHLDISQFGYVWTIIAAALLVGSSASTYLLALVRDEKLALVISQLLLASGIIATVTLPSAYLALPAFFIYEVSWSMFRPLKDAFLHDNIPSEKRATVASCESVSSHLGGIIGLIASGLLVRAYSIPTTWIIFGSLLILGTLLVAKNGKH